MAVVVVATIRPLPDRRAEVIAAMEAVIARVHAEDDGCLLYSLHEGPDRLVMIEKWSSAEALDTHLRASAALTELVGKLDGLLEAPPDIQTLQPHPAGTAEQGTL
jgi:quinol monooxygenase YgiN